MSDDKAITEEFLASLGPMEREFAVRNNGRLAPEGYVAIKFEDWQRAMAKPV